MSAYKFCNFSAILTYGRISVIETLFDRLQAYCNLLLTMWREARSNYKTFAFVGCPIVFLAVK